MDQTLAPATASLIGRRLLTFIDLKHPSTLATPHASSLSGAGEGPHGPQRALGLWHVSAEGSHLGSAFHGSFGEYLMHKKLHLSTARRKMQREGSTTNILVLRLSLKTKMGLEHLKTFLKLFFLVK